MEFLEFLPDTKLIVMKRFIEALLKWFQWKRAI